MAAGGASSASNILYQDSDVCILDPKSDRGVVLFSLADSDKVCKEGLLSYTELSKRHHELGLKPRKAFGGHNIDHDELIYFRAPYTQDTTSFESSFKGKTPETIVNQEESGRSIVLLRVDPDKTNVFFSLARTGIGGAPFESYKQTLTDYIKSPISDRGPRGEYMMTIKNIRGDVTYEEDWEVVVKLPHIPPDWFVSCIFNGKEVWNRWQVSAEENKASESQIEITEPFLLGQIDKNLNMFGDILRSIPYVESVNIMKYSFDPEHHRRIRIKTNKEREGHTFEIVFKINISSLLIENETYQEDVLTHIDLTQEQLDSLYGSIDKFLDRMKELVLEYREKHKNNNKNSEAALAAGGASGGGRRRKTKSKQSKKSKKSKHAAPRRHTTKRRQRRR